MSTEFRGSPGIYAGPTLKARNIFVSYDRAIQQFYASTSQLDGISRDCGENPTSLIRAGVLLGAVTGTNDTGTIGNYRPSIYGLMAGGGSAAASATTIYANAAVVTEIARVRTLKGGNINLTITGPAVAGASQTVNRNVVACSAASGTTLTIAALTNGMVVGSLIQPADGSDVPMTVLANQYGKDVQDTSGNAITQPIEIPVRGADLFAAKVPCLTADDFGNTTEAACTAWIKLQLRNVGGSFTFDTDRLP
jgi:hypothetical protein